MRRGVLTGKRHRTRGAVIEMAPLIDMVFILLIFYIVSTSFVQDSGVVVDRPRSDFATPVASRYLPVAITKAGTVHVQGHSIAADDRAAIRHALEEAGVQRVVIEADRAVPTGLLLEVLDSSKAAGAVVVDVAAIRD
jgi:biopolymer transport protein ExbD